jgi:hypothetical protein
VARLGKGGVGGFGEELYGARAEPPQGPKRYRSERIPRAGVVCVAVPALVSVSKSGCVARGAGCGTQVWSSERMNEGDTSKHVTGAGVRESCNRVGYISDGGPSLRWWVARFFGGCKRYRYSRMDIKISPGSPPKDYGSLGLLRSVPFVPGG